MFLHNIDDCRSAPDIDTMTCRDKQAGMNKRLEEQNTRFDMIQQYYKTVITEILNSLK